MVFRLPRFVRRFLRARMHPMKEEKAWDVKQRIALIYSIIAWNAGGFVLYQMMKGNKSWPITAGIRTPDEDIARPAYQWAKTLGIPKAQVYRIKTGGDLSKKEDFELREEDMPADRKTLMRTKAKDQETLVA